MTVAHPMRITLLTGGVGGTKLAQGLAALLPPAQLTLIGNIGDDECFHGLWVSPDIDTLTYTLAGLVNQATGWGLAGDTFETLGRLKALGQDTWMQLGDRDLATHIVRSEQRRQGIAPSVIAQDIARRLGVNHPIVLPSDDDTPTRIHTLDGRELSMQCYFVRERCQAQVQRVEYAGAHSARPSAAALIAIQQADVLLIAPSNPILSIGPILAIPAIRRAIEGCRGYRVAMSPLINGLAIKGPTSEVLQGCGYQADVHGIAHYYDSLIDALVIDQQDGAHKAALEQRGLDVYCQNTLMTGLDSRITVAQTLLDTLKKVVRV